MTRQHTPEPWRVAAKALVRLDSAYLIEAVENHDFKYGATLAATSQQDARRIVACVNACTGLPTEWLEKNALTDCTSSHKLIKQRDDLLAALEDAVETIEWMNGCSSPAVDEVEKAIREGNSAISKAKGGAA